MAWTNPITHAVGFFVDAPDWNNEITENHKAIIATAPTTIAALNTRWGSPPPDGANGRLKIGVTPFDFIDLVYDTATTSWVSEAEWTPMQTAAWGATGQALDTPIEIGNKTYAATHPWQIYEDAGLTLQLRILGVFGSEATGTINANFVRPSVAGLAYGAAPTFAFNVAATNAHITGLALSATATTGTMRTGIWASLDVGYTPTDTYALGAQMLQQGTGTANFYAANVMIGSRWVSA